MKTDSSALDLYGILRMKRTVIAEIWIRSHFGARVAGCDGPELQRLAFLHLRQRINGGWRHEMVKLLSNCVHAITHSEFNSRQCVAQFNLPNYCCVAALLFLQNEGKESEDEDDSDDYAESDDSDAVKTPRKKKPMPSKKKRAGQASFSNSAGSGAKRLKKVSDLASYAITETKTPGSSDRASTGQTGRQSLGTPVGAPSARSSPHSGARSMMGIGSPVSPPPKAPSSTPLPEGVLDTGRHKHHSFDWLYKNRLDANRRGPDHPLYNPRTLYVPPSFLKKETPAMVQWWKFKSENMDTVLFFKVPFVV